MIDIYNRQITFANPISADNVFVSIPGLTDTAAANNVNGLGLLVQQTQLTYAQQTTQLYDVTSTDVTAFIGRSQGSVGLQSVMANRRVTDFFIDQYGDGCNILNNQLSFHYKDSACGAQNQSGAGALSFTAHYCILASFNLGVTAQQAMVSQGFQVQTSAVDRTGAGGVGGAAVAGAAGAPFNAFAGAGF